MSETGKLKATLAEIIDLLALHGDQYVVERLRRDEQRLTAGDHEVIASLIAEATGGSGSLRDRYLCVSNGDQIASSDETRINAQLVQLVERLRFESLAARTAAGASS